MKQTTITLLGKEVAFYLKNTGQYAAGKVIEETPSMLFQESTKLKIQLPWFYFDRHKEYWTNIAYMYSHQVKLLPY